MRWTFVAGDNVDSSPVVAGRHVVVGSDDGRLRVLDLADGREAWKYEAGAAIPGSPAIAGGWVVIACSDGWVHAFRSGP